MESESNKVARASHMLLRQLGEEKVVSSGPGYDKSRNIWNAAVAYRPKLVILCHNTDDVRSAVSAASIYGLTISVRGGGHDWAGRSVRGELVIDLTCMRKVTIDGQVAIVEGGALSSDVAAAVSAHGMTAVTGIIGSVGVAGLTLGGGYGHLTAKFGMALDNVIKAEVVLPDGRAVWTDSTNEPDLFWAIRGGGGNFGVITSLGLRLHQVPSISDDIVTFGWDQTKDVMREYNATIATLPDELTVMPTFFATPDGDLSIVLHHAYCGDPRRDEFMVEKVRGLGRASLVQIRRKTIAEILREAEKRTMEGVSWIIRTVTLPALGPEVVEEIMKAMENRSSPLSWIASHPFYGAGERIPLTSTAFGIRTRHFMIGIYTAWRSGDEAAHKAWSDKVESALRPYAMQSAYPNYFGADRPEQAALAYGENKDRLLRLKHHYDPNGIFNAISLPTN